MPLSAPFKNMSEWRLEEQVLRYLSHAKAAWHNAVITNGAQSARHLEAHARWTIRAQTASQELKKVRGW